MAKAPEVYRLERFCETQRLQQGAYEEYRKSSNTARRPIQSGDWMRTAEVVLSRRILRDLRVLRNTDPSAYQACVDRILAGLREDAREPKPVTVWCKHGFNRGHWLQPASLGHCNGPDIITSYLQTNGVSA
jgi:hypothetical protein